MRSFFAFLTRVSLQFRWVTLALSLVIAVFGVVGLTQLQLELIPAIEFPQTVILTQVSGMSSDEVLEVLTKRIETQLETIPEIVNVESTTTGAFGSVVIARNDFGLNQDRLREQMRAAFDQMWLPLRRFEAPDGQDTTAFVSATLGTLTPEVMLWLEERDPNFLFQLTPQVWETLPDDTVRAALAYLAAQTEQTAASDNALRRLVDQEILPQLEAIDAVASVNISGGQQLPGENGAAVESQATPTTEEARSLLYQLSPEVWAVVAPKVGLTTLDAQAVETLTQQEQISVPTQANAPALPEAWLQDGFTDARDLLEMRGATTTLAAVFNNFARDGVIVGPLGQTDDLTPEIVTQMLAIAPSMVNYFEAEHLAAMSDDVFAVLPQEFIDGLDGFARDELAASALAAAITGQDIAPTPVNLPNAWRIGQPQLVTFSFDDLPLATYSVFAAEGVASAPQSETASDAPAETTAEQAVTEQPAAEQPAATQPVTDAPKGPALPQLLGVFGGVFGAELDSADDLLNITLPAELSALAPSGSLKAADFLNFMLLLEDPAALQSMGGGEGGAGFDLAQFDIQTLLPALTECGINPLALTAGTANLAQGIIGCLSADVIAYLAEYDPTFAASLQDGVYPYFTDEVLALDTIAPPLPDVWDTLAARPQFGVQPLSTAGDVLALGQGQASQVLNAINASVPTQFAGYEVRLFDSLAPVHLRYWAIQEADFYANLDSAVLLKMSQDTLASLPQTVTDGFTSETAAQVAAIADGTQETAAQALASLYTSNVPPADPAAPALAGIWPFVGERSQIELDSADDFFRFTEAGSIESPAALINGTLTSGQARQFASDLVQGLTPQVIEYMLAKDPTVFDTLDSQVLQDFVAFAPENLALLPQALQDRAQEGGQPFQPTAAITRTTGASSLLITLYKQGGTNTVAAFHEADEVIKAIDEANPNIETSVVFEQASFIEESISGVAREGGLGGVFAIVMILIFLSSGVWGLRPRRIAGAVLVGVSLVTLFLLTSAQLDAAGGDWNVAFGLVNIVFSVPMLLALIAGLFFILWPGRVPYPAWRSTLVTAVSIPLSVLMALALMRWLPGSVHNVLVPASDNALVAFFMRLFPESITLNIMTLSGLTVAIGRVVDDSIVVLENIFRELQKVDNTKAQKRQAIITGTRDVSIAIFAATVITVVVFLPLGLTGGLIGEFFLPFGLAVTYSLLASFIVAITVVPVMVYLFVRADEVHEEDNGPMERAYVPLLRWALSGTASKLIVLFVAFASLVFGLWLFGSRPAAFLPDFGEPQISVSVNMPAGTTILETNEKVAELEAYIAETFPEEEIKAVQVIVGSSGISFENLLLGGGGVTENAAQVTIGVESLGNLDPYAQQIRTAAEGIFGAENATVSAASISAQGFGSFALVLSGPQEDLAAIDAKVIETLNGVTGLANVSSSLSDLAAQGAGSVVTYLRVDGQTANRYTGELETEDSLNVIGQAKEAVLALPDLPASISVSEGFETEVQTEGFQSLFVAMGIAIVIVVLILIITFGSLAHWLDIMLSVVVAPVGAAIALTLTDRVLGISALIGLLMLIGIVVTNAVVLIDRVMANRRERHMGVNEALIEAGGRRLRPIVMTAFATIFALLPLAVGLSEGAIIAAELGTVVIGGLFSSTLLTLIVVPVAYSLLDPLHLRILRLLGRKPTMSKAPQSAD